MEKLLVILISWVVLFITQLQGQDLNLTKTPEKLDLTPYITYYSTSKLKQTPFEILKQEFKKPPKGRLSFSYSNDDFWFKFKLVNDSDRDISKFYEINYAVLDEVDVYILRDGAIFEQHHTGDLRPFDTRPKNTRTFVFPIVSRVESEVTVLVRIHTQSSVFVPMTLWEPHVFEDHEDKAVLFQGLYYGCMMVMIAYNLFVFCVVRHRSYLYYSLFVLCTFIFQATIQGFGFKYFWGDFFWLNTQGLIMFVAFVGMFGALFCVEFLQLRKEGSSRIELKIMYGVSIVSSVLVLLSLFLPPNVIVRMTSLLALLSPAPAGFIGFRRAIKGQQSAQVYTLAWVVFLVGTVGLALSRFGLVPSSLLTEYGQLIGSAAQVVLLSIALANKLNELKSELQIVNAKLQDHIENVEHIVEQKTMKIRSILKNIRQGIFTISDNLVVDAECSDHLLTTLGMGSVSGKSLDQVLLSRCQITSDEKSQVRSALDLGIGESIFTFESNAELLVNEVSFENHRNENRILELDWDPIVNQDDVVERVLVCVRDVTTLKELEMLNAERQRELEYISEILNISEMAFAKFLRTGGDLIAESKRIIEGKNLYDSDTLKLLFLNMHTLKGTSRSYSFKHLTNVIHEVEQSYVEIKSGKQRWDLDQISSDLNRVSEALALYRFVNEKKLGRVTKQEQTYIKVKDVELILEEIHNLDQIESLDQRVVSAKRTIKDIVNNIYFVPANNVLEEIFSSSHRLAKDLEKNDPNISIEGCRYGISDKYEELFQRVFVHLLRNSIFHGIETPARRQEQSKDPRGTITVDFSKDGENLEIIYYDDGQGLDLEAIKEKSIKMGTAVPDDASDEVIANLIFTPGMTTAIEENDISGRGVGMDAIRKFVNDNAGKVSLELYGEKREGRFVSFKVKILLPPPHFTSLDPIHSDRLVS